MGFLHSIYKSFFINSSLQPATESDRSTCTRKGHDTSHPSCSPKGDAPTCSYKSSPLPQNTSTGCPFGFSSTRCDDIDDVERDEEVQNAGVSSTGATTFTPPLSGRNRVVLLYEHYIHLPALRAVWESPITERPELEPCFSAACHGMEIGYLLLAHFLTDQRTYVQKRSRVELVMEDLMRQYSLLAELVDGELEEEGPLDQCVRDGHAQPPTRGSGSPAPRPPQLLPSCSPSSPAFSLGAATDGSEDGSPTSFTETDSSSGSHLRTQGMGNPPSPSGGKTGGDKTDIPGGERPTSRSWGFPVPIKEEGSDQEAPVRLQPPRPLFSLTQDFPFPCCPPTSTVGARSPSLDLLLEALAQSLPAMTPSERVSVSDGGWRGGGRQVPELAFLRTALFTRGGYPLGFHQHSFLPLPAASFTLVSPSPFFLPLPGHQSDPEHHPRPGRSLPGLVRRSRHRGSDERAPSLGKPGPPRLFPGA